MSPDADRFSEARDRLVEQVINTFRRAETTHVEKALQLSVEIEDTDPLAWLAAQNSEIKFYWRNRKGDFEMAGIGVADSVSVSDSAEITPALDRIHRTLPDGDASIRYFGGMSFDINREVISDGPWKAFGNGLFILPRFLLIRKGNSSRLACNTVPAGGNNTSIEAILEDCRLLIHPTNMESRPTAAIARYDNPDQTGWTAAVEKALDLIGRGKLSKVVLAREAHLEFDKKVNAWVLLAALRASGSQQYLFGFQPQSGRAFVSATPERLYKRDETTIHTEALAGTRPRGADRPEDERLATELLQSEKDRREHRIVLDTLAGHLETLCEEMEIDDEVTIKKTPAVQHLLARLIGQLKSGFTDADILMTLHPTPAVGGLPQKPALRAIAELEPFHRAWYAGPVGWVDNGAAEFAVAIRSALVHTTGVTLYSGAGIVAGSDPKSEWQEIESKIAGFLKVLVNT